ncbi:unnamed protein product, partial [Symbiodinium natans]
MGGVLGGAVGTWKDDGSEAVQDGKDGSFSISGKEGGSPVCALYSKPVSSGEYFEVTCESLKDSVFIGVSTEAAFAKGYKCRGLFFGGPGNLSNGSGLIRGGFGESIKQGDVVGFLTEFDDKSVKVTVYQDGRCLGLAFESPRQDASAQIFPVVQAKADGDKFKIATKSAPSAKDRQPAAKTHFAVGTWKLEKLMLGPELGEFPLADKMGDKPVTVTIKDAGDKKFHMSAKVANTINNQVTVQDDPSAAPFEAVQVAGGMSTMMMGDGGEMEVETKLGGLSDVRKWIFSDETLLLQGPTIEASLKPYVEEMSP